MKNLIFVLIIVVLIAASSGCLGGGALPTLKEELTNLDAALADYDHAKGLYTQGDYQNAKQAFIESVDAFKACNKNFDGIAKTDISTLEKRDASNLAGCSLQFAYAAAYMRDACAEATKSGADVDFMVASADECELIGRNVYQINRDELQLAWSSK